MNIEELKEEIKNIQEPRRTRYGNIRHKLEDNHNHRPVYDHLRRGRFCRYGGVWQKSSGISGEIS